ncbi:unnamed protein product, partial [Oppiella nova]
MYLMALFRFSGIGFVLIYLLTQLNRVECHSWQNPGCHKVVNIQLNRINDDNISHTQRISIPDCVEFDITTNACRGYCVSFSIPSNEATLRVNPNQLLTSVGQCCNIMETEDP